MLRRCVLRCPHCPQGYRAFIRAVLPGRYGWLDSDDSGDSIFFDEFQLRFDGA